VASSIPTSLPWALTGCTYDGSSGSDLRNSTVATTFYDPGPSGTGGTIALAGGVLGGAGLLVRSATGMAVTVDPGHFVVPNTAIPVAGGYAATLPAQGTLTVETADPSNPRYDIVCAGATDNGDSSSSGWVQIIAGNPAASPLPPAAPPNSITLAQILIPAGSTSVTSGNITGLRTFTTAVGGIPVAPKGSLLGYVGQLAYDPASSSFYHNENAGNTPLAVQARTLPFAPVMAVLTGGAFTLSPAPAQVPGLSAVITTDGRTDLKLTYHVAGFTAPSSAVTYAGLAVYVDGVLVDQTISPALSTVNAQGGLTGTGYTSSLLGNTPAAGSHTVTVQAWSSSGAPQIHAFAGVPASAWLRVEPVGL